MKKFTLACLLALPALAVATPAFADGCNGICVLGIGGQFGINWGGSGVNGCASVGPYAGSYNNGPLYDYSSYFAGQCDQGYGGHHGYGDVGSIGGYPGYGGGYGGYGQGYGAPVGGDIQYGARPINGAPVGAPVGGQFANPQGVPVQVNQPRIVTGQTTGFRR